MKYLLHLAVAYALVAALLYPLSKRDAATPNIILISLDTLRADHLSCYGYHRPTPNLESFARDSILFENAFSQAPWTTASHMSLFSSLYPTVHRISHEAMSDVRITLTHHLKERGYQTAAFVEATALDRRFGFGEGFDVYRGKSDDPSARANNERARDWLRARDRQAPFFLFLHYYDIHRKYDPPAPYNRLYCDTCDPSMDSLIVGPYGKMRRIPQADLYNLMALYDSEIRYVDDRIKELMDFLKQENLYDGAMIILLADHGEGFLEHGLMDHGNSLYQELLHVPMIIKMPGNRNRGTRQKAAVRLIDVFPTFLDLLSIRTHSLLQGSSLLPLLRGASSSEDAVLSSGGIGSESIVSKQWKLIHNNELEKRLSMIPLAVNAEFELYNLESDPLEWNNLAGIRTDKQKELMDMLQAQRALNERYSSRIHVDHKPLDHEIEEQLRSLGYIQ